MLPVSLMQNNWIRCPSKQSSNSNFTEMIVIPENIFKKTRKGTQLLRSTWINEEYVKQIQIKHKGLDYSKQMSRIAYSKGIEALQVTK